MTKRRTGDVWVAGASARETKHFLGHFHKGDDIEVNGVVYRVRSIDFDPERNMQITLDRKV